jgi:predicted metal-dependent HD superfamily phosphohydrolase
MSESIRRRWDESVFQLLCDLTPASSLDDHPQTPTQLDQAALDAISNTSDTWFNKVQSLYNEPHRAYHNWTHAEDVLSSLDFLLQHQTQMDVTPDHVAILTLAAFFHDVIYNPKSSTNEKDSADLFQEFVEEVQAVMSSHLNNPSVQGSVVATEIKSHIASKVTECIIASASHILSSMKANETNDIIVAIFLDADISILGKPSDAYDKYAGCIRKEYSFVEREVYCSKRAGILEGFLPMDAAASTAVTAGGNEEKRHQYVFATEVGRAEWEVGARSNLKREIELLRHGVIPLEDARL